LKAAANNRYPVKIGYKTFLLLKT